MDKKRVVIILAVVAVLLLVLNIGSCVNVYNQNASRKKEMLQRMTLEEKTVTLIQDIAKSAAKLAAMQKELDAEKAGNEAAKKALAQEQMVTSSLKEDLQKLTKRNEVLESELNKDSASKKVKK